MSNKAQCSHILTTGKNKGAQCTKNASKGEDKCYVHNKPSTKKEINIKDDPIFNDEPKQTKPKPPKTSKYSIYHMTINSNKDYTKMTDDEKIKFKQYADYLFKGENILKFVKDLSNPENPAIEKTKINYYFEVGDKLHRLHLHALVKIKHNGYMKMEANMLRETSKQMLGYAVHINCPVSSNSEKSWEKYISKKQDSNVIQLD